MAAPSSRERRLRLFLLTCPLYPATSEADSFNLIRTTASGMKTVDTVDNRVVDLMDALNRTPEPILPAAHGREPQQASGQTGRQAQAGRVMAMLPFPGRYAQLQSRRSDPRDRLQTLQYDVASTKAAIRAALDVLAHRHRIPARDITCAIDSYVDDLLDDAIYRVERGLEHDIENDDPV